jgi:mxaD protein
MKKIFAFMAIALLPLLPLTASAHGAAALRFEKTITIKAAPATVWALVKDFGNEQAWHPSVESTKLENKKDENGDDAVYRTVALKGGGAMYEKLRTADDAGMKIKYEYILEKSTLQFANFYPAITVTAGPGAGESTVSVKGSYTRADSSNIPKPDQNDEAATKALNDFFDAGLANLKVVAENPAKK